MMTMVIMGVLVVSLRTMVMMMVMMSGGDDDDGGGVGDDDDDDVMSRLPMSVLGDRLADSASRSRC